LKYHEKYFPCRIAANPNIWREAKGLQRAKPKEKAHKPVTQLSAKRNKETPKPLRPAL
jgi:hypothetical protein